MPKDLEGFLVEYRAEKCHFLGEFSRISGSKRSPAVCTTVVQLGILWLMAQFVQVYFTFLRYFCPISVYMV